MQGGAYEAGAAGEGSLSLPQEVQPTDLYELLEVSPRASAGVIQAAYRVLARAHHPDVNDSADTVKVMRRLNAAYAVLSDPKRRARYDAQFTSPPPRPAHRPRARVEQRRGRAQPQLALGSHRPQGAQMLARLLVIALLISMAIGAVLFAWVLLVDPDDRPSPGYRPRGAAPEISVPAAASIRSSRRCGLLQIDPVAC
jgi:curved DNA-binding protein CbpA